MKDSKGRPAQSGQCLSTHPECFAERLTFSGFLAAGVKDHPDLFESRTHALTLAGTHGGWAAKVDYEETSSYPRYW